MASRRRRHSNATIELLPGEKHTLPYDPETTTNFYLPDSSHSFGINIKSSKKKTIVNLHVTQPKPENSERAISERETSEVTQAKPEFSERAISNRETSEVTQPKPENSERAISDRETSEVTQAKPEFSERAISNRETSEVTQPKPENSERAISDRETSEVTQPKPEFSERAISERETSEVTQPKPEFSERAISERETSKGRGGEDMSELFTKDFKGILNVIQEVKDYLKEIKKKTEENANLTSQEQHAGLEMHTDLQRVETITDHTTRLWENDEFGSGENVYYQPVIMTETKQHIYSQPVSVRVLLPRRNGNGQKILNPEGEIASNQKDKPGTSLEELYQAIKDPFRQNDALYQLQCLKEIMNEEVEGNKENIKEKVHAFFLMKPEKMTLVELVATYEQPSKQTLLTLVLELFPELLYLDRKESKPSALHTLAYNRNREGAKVVLQSALECNQLENHLTKVVLGKYQTRMMGEVALFIAALSFDNEMVEFLIGKGAKVRTIVSGGNTVFHLLIRYAYFYPEHKTAVQEMMKKLNNFLQIEENARKDLHNSHNMNEENSNKTQLSLWYKTNDNGLTVLQLAALLGQHELFKWILELEGVYVKYEKINDHIECVRFDITELDYVALNRFRNPNPKKRENSNCFSRRGNAIIPASRKTERADTSQGKENATKIYSRAPSVIEIICETMKTKKAYHFINIPPIDHIIDTKWKHYKVWLTIWFILHLGIMALLAGQAVVKALLINNSHQLMSTTQATTFFYVVSVILFVWGIVYLVLEGFGVYNRFPRFVLQAKHNWDYHLLLIVFSLCLMADAIWSWKQGPQNTYFLAIALVVGGWFLSFFSQLSQYFSVFTAMLRGALLRDGKRVIVILLSHFVAFSFAMYVLYLPTPGGPPAEFENLGMTFLTMFMLMLNLTDLEILTRAPSPWLTVPLIIIFIVLTYILVLNILIAFISNTASEMLKNKEMYWKLQRLAVVVMIEQMVPLCWAFNSAEGSDEDNQRFLSIRFHFEKQAPHLNFK